MGIYYPDQPTPEYQEKTKNFIQTLSLLYPCSHCAEDFQQEIKKSPPR
jgi:FAD-linked sulfhydryl oxidase